MIRNKLLFMINWSKIILCFFYFNLSEHSFFAFYSNLLNLLGFTIYLASSWVLGINEGVLVTNRFEISSSESELIQHRNFFEKKI